MQHKIISLSDKNPDATLVTYIHEEDNDSPLPKRGAVIVCPGGGYEILCPREGEPVAMSFFAAGFQAFVLNYSLRENAANYAPAIEVATAVKTVREHATEWNVDPGSIFTLGFSAGGHVAASAGTLWNSPAVRAALDGAPEGIWRPDGMILCYPVISAEPFGHLPSIFRCCGTYTPTAEEMDRFSLEKQVDATTPPAFLFHCWDDACVSVRNSLVFADALLAHGGSCEAHIFRHGDHGISMGTPETCGDPSSEGYPDVTSWLPLAITWAKHLKQ